MLPSLTVTVALALIATANPLVVRQSPVTIPLARRFNLTGTKTLREHDLARVQHFKSGTKTKANVAAASASASSFPVNVVNGAVSYTAEVLIGNPPHPFNLIVDSGSSNTFAGTNTAGNPFEESSTTKQTGQLLEVTFGSGFVIGEEVIDTVQVGELVIPGQSLGAALLSDGFEGVDGIIGIGPTDLTEDTTSGGGTVPTVTDNAFSQGSIAVKEIGISFAPITGTNLSDPNGQLTFGGIDSTKFTGPLVKVPITKTSPSNEFVGIDQSITFGSAATPVLASTAGIVDTGTTLTLIASDAFATYQQLTGGVMDEATGLLKITPAQFANLQSLFFNIGGTAFEFTPNAQIWPRALNTAIGGQPGSIYLVVSDLGTESGSGMDFINGLTWLERFFFLWDSGTPQAGFATTPFTDATTN